jgi:DNA-binding MarR family transcriptional regulator
MGKSIHQEMRNKSKQSEKYNAFVAAHKGTMELNETAGITLPEFSNKVYEALYDRLENADPGFSEITAADLAQELGVSEQAIGGAVSHLVKQNLVNVEEWDGNQVLQYFLHINELDARA